MKTLAILTAQLGAALLFSSTGKAESLKPAFQSDLIWVKYPDSLQIEDRNPPQEKDAASAKPVSSRVKLASKTLVEPVFDVSASLRSQGVVLPEGSRAILSPRQQLLYIRSTADDIDLTQTLFKTCCPNQVPEVLFTCDLRATVTTDGKVKTLLNMKSIGFVSGQVIRAAVEEKDNLQLEISPIVGPDGNTVDLQIDAISRIGKRTIRLSNMRQMKLTAPADLTLDDASGTALKLHIQVHRIPNYLGPAALKNEKTKAAAIKEIEALLKAAP